MYSTSGTAVYISRDFYHLRHPPTVALNTSVFRSAQALINPLNMSGKSKSVSEVEKDPSKVDFNSDGKLRFYPDNPTHETHKQAFKNKQPSQFYDPCAEASQMSLNCLDRNNYDKKKCIPYFQAYRDCKKEFVRYRKKDQENGIW